MLLWQLAIMKLHTNKGCIAAALASSSIVTVATTYLLLHCVCCSLLKGDRGARGGIGYPGTPGAQVIQTHFKWVGLNLPSHLSSSLHFFLLQGPGGEPGPDGEDGARGPEGKQGAPGDDGHPGKDVSHMSYMSVPTTEYRAILILM